MIVKTLEASCLRFSIYDLYLQLRNRFLHCAQILARLSHICEQPNSGAQYCDLQALFGSLKRGSLANLRHLHLCFSFVISRNTIKDKHSAFQINASVNRRQRKKVSRFTWFTHDQIKTNTCMYRWLFWLRYAAAVLFLLTVCQCGNLFLTSIFDRHIKPNRNIWGIYGHQYLDRSFSLL